MASPMAHSQWSLRVKNLLRPPNHNVRLFLHYEDASPSPTLRTFRASLDFRRVGESGVYLHREVSFQHDGGKPFFVDLRLPPGRYEVEGEIEDRRLSTYASVELPEVLVVPDMGEGLGNIYLSDIFLAPPRSYASVFEVPQLMATITHARLGMHYAMEVNAPGLERITIRAVLYVESPTQAGTSTRAYESRHQVNVVLPLDELGRGTFRDTLDLQSLTWGEYMIQILVYQEEEFIMDKKTWFNKGGDTEEQIFDELDKSIRMMRYLVPEKQLTELLELTDMQVKQVEFLKIWNKLYGDEAQNRMEAYYQKVYDANGQFAEGEKEGWVTDRGRVFITYGKPVIKALEINGKPYERWTYPRWALSFLFEKRNQAFLLIE